VSTAGTPGRCSSLGAAPGVPRGCVSTVVMRPQVWQRSSVVLLKPRSHFTVTNAGNGMYRDWKRCTAMGRVPRGASRNVLAVYKDLVQARLVTMAMQCGLLPFRLALRPEVL